MNKKFILIIVLILIVSLGIYKLFLDRYEFKELNTNNRGECLVKIDKISGNSCSMTESSSCKRAYPICE